MSYSYVAGLSLQAIYFVLIARTLGASEFGLFAGALALVTAFASMAGLGAGNVLVMATARDPGAYRRQLGTAWLYIALTFLPLAGTVALIAFSIMPGTAWIILPLLASELVFARLFDVGLQSFQAHDRLQGVAHFNVAAAGLRVALTAMFSVSDVGGAVAWAWCYAGVTTLSAIVLMVVCVRRFGRPVIDRDSLTRTWRVGVFFALGMSSRILLNDSDKFVLVGNGDEAAAGQYSAAHRLVNMSFAPLQAMTYALNTELFRAGRNGYRAAWRVLRRVLPIAFGYILVVTALLASLGPVVVDLLGQDYSLITQMMPLLALTLFGQTAYYFFGDALMGLGKQSWRGTSQATVGAAVLLANVLTVPAYGWHASAVIAVAASLLLGLLLTGLFFRGLARERRVDLQSAENPPSDSTGLQEKTPASPCRIARRKTS